MYSLGVTPQLMLSNIRYINTGLLGIFSPKTDNLYVVHNCMMLNHHDLPFFLVLYFFENVQDCNSTAQQTKPHAA